MYQVPKGLEGYHHDCCGSYGDSYLLRVGEEARVVEEYANTVASPKDTHGGNTSRGRGKYFQPRGQSFKRGGHVPQGQGGFKKNTYNQFQYAKGRGNQSKTSPDLTCVRCGRFYPYDSCKIGIGGCFDCGLPGPIARDCTREPKCVSESAPRAIKELGLKVSELAFELHVHTPHQTVMTRLGYRQVGFKLEGRDFVHDLICLPMVGLEMILGFDWLSKNRTLDQIPIVRDFPEVFPKDIPEFPPQREIEFVIELVSEVRPVSIALYQMASIELAELKA
nr:uncharacterized protein LOC112721473 [Arachis hypogaea]